MYNINSFSVVGRLGQDPDHKEFPSGAQLVNFSIAVRRKKDVTDWFDCVSWDKTAEIINKYTSKGSQVAISGTVYHDVWTDKDGAVRSKPVLKVEKVTLCDSKNKGVGGEGGDWSSSSPPQAPAYSDF